jgi:hypothetical protein
MTRLPQQPSRKGQESLHVVEIGDHADGDPHCAAGFAVYALAELVNRQVIFVLRLCEADIQLDARDAKGNFTRTWIAEAPSSQ